MTTAQKVIAAARSQVGYHEGHDPVNGWNNQEKYAPEVPGLAWAQGQPWCDVFVAWCFQKAGVLNLLPGGPSASVAFSRDHWKAINRFSQYPAVGAQAIFGTKGDAHTGIVVSYTATTVTTVEGNTNTNGSPEGDGVYLKTHQRTDPWVYGYGYPAYPEGIVSADPAWQNKPTPTPTPAPAVKVRHRFVGTMNERDAVDPTHPHLIPIDTVQADTEKFAQQISFGGIQEWPANRDAILNSLPGFDSTRNPAHKVPGPPVLWRTERFTLCTADAPVGAKGRNVGKLPGRKSVLGDYRYTRVILEDTNASGSQRRDVVVFNVHFPAHWQLWPGKRRQMAVEYEKAVAADVKAHAGSYDVYVVGDTNWGYLKRVVARIAPQKVMNRAGLVACWYGHTPRATLGRRTVDMIWHQGKATRQPETLKTASDHLAVVATY